MSAGIFPKIRLAVEAFLGCKPEFFSSLLVTSGRTESELKQGKYRGQAASIATVKRLIFLAEIAEVKQCAAVYLATKLVPASKIGDAIQLAFSTIHRVDYLLTWNHAHLANAEVQERLEDVNQQYGWRSPRLVSPETIPWATLGQNIRRKDAQAKHRRG